MKQLIRNIGVNLFFVTIIMPLITKSVLGFYPLSIKGYKTSNFGEYRSNSYLHDGVDIACRNEEVYPVAPGYIEEYDDKGKEGYGYWILINHGSFKTRYCHLKAIPKLVKEKLNQRVETTEVIALSGNTGKGGKGSWPYHLHFEYINSESKKS